MDSKIRSYSAIDFGNGLNFCPRHGIVYQRDISETIDYDWEYFSNYQRYEKSPISDTLNDFRVNLSTKYAKTGILDVGIGCGTFLVRCPKNIGILYYGYDVNPLAKEWLFQHDDIDYYNPYDYNSISDNIDVVCLWDVLEHIANPDLLLSRFRKGTFLLLSLPIFERFSNLLESKHHKPNEHLLYFSSFGLWNYLMDMGFDLEWSGDDESRIGRESIMSFVFRKQ